MRSEIKILLERAEIARLSYKKNLITREEAKKEIMPYITAYNEKAKQIAKKYNAKPKLINFSSFIR